MVMSKNVSRTSVLIDGEDKEKVTDLLLFRKIVKAEECRLTLDNGTILRVIPNDGCGGCMSGNYWIDHIRKFDHVITNVEIETAENEEEYTETIKVFVFSDSEIKEQIISVSGDEGNGWYGRGFEIYVKTTDAGE